MKIKILLSFGAIILSISFIYLLSPEIVRLPLLKTNRFLSGLSTKTIKVGDHNIHYLEGGSGPTIILLHGIFSEKDHWVDFARQLTKNYHVIIPDLAGFGESTRLSNVDYSYQDQTKYFGDFVKVLSLSSFHLAGNSMGGTIAAIYSIEHKSEVLSLAFIGGPHGVKTSELSEMDIELNAGRTPLVPKTEEEFDHMLSMLFHKPPFIPSPILKHSKAHTLALKEDNLRIFQQQFKERYLLQSQLTEISTPSFVLWGKYEKIFHSDGAKIIQQISKAKTTVEIVDAGHLPQMEIPAESAELYQTFLKNL